MKRLALALLTVALAGVTLAAEEPRLVKPINLAINTRDDEDEPHVASDGKTLYYSVKVKAKGKEKEKEGTRQAIAYTTRTATTRPWGKAHLFDDFFEAESEVRGVFLTPEGTYPQVMYFGLFASEKAEGSKGNWDVVFGIRERAGKGVGPTRPLLTIDTTKDELHPWLTPGAAEIYFSRKTDDGWRVYVAERTNKADKKAIPSFGDPVLIKELPANFHHATLMPDGKTMYLQGPLEKDRWGLFVSTKSNTGWSKPEPLTMLNHPDGKIGDLSPNLSRDGALLYFASDRPEGKGGLDIWVIATKELVIKKKS
jgi:hypothetical protein